MFRLLSILAMCLPLISAARAQDAGDGERVFAACKLCHQVGEGAKSLAGPSLNGIVGRKAAAVTDYEYSPANRDANITWTEAELTAFIANPKARLPGNKMLYPGLRDDEKIADVIAFLKQFDINGKKKR